MSPLVSVVLPVYNVEAYIGECVDSILNQSFQDFEIIVIDDCSTDNTIKLIESYNDPRIVIKKKETNKGLIDSLNLSLVIAKGKYIARMDGDDISKPERFQKQLDILENNNNIDVCGCWLKQFGMENRIIKYKEYHDEILANMLWSCSMGMCSVMFKRKAFEGFKFDETKKHVEDYDFWSRVAWSSTFYNIQEVLYLYRVHNTQISTIYKQTQEKGDIAIKLFLFKKLDYNSDMFTDDLIIKFLLLDQFISVEEFKSFLKWLKALKALNFKKHIYSQKELERILDKIKSALLFSIYFKKTNIGITKKWRLKALLNLPIGDASYIIKRKIRERTKAIIKA